MVCLLHSFSNNFPAKPLDELKIIYSRVPTQEYYEDRNSLWGRALCFGHIFSHGFQILGKPALFIVLTIYDICKVLFAIITCSSVKNRVILVGKRFCCIITSPLGHIAGTCRAIVGVIHPGAYYRIYPQDEQNNLPTKPEFNLVKHIERAVIALSGAILLLHLRR